MELELQPKLLLDKTRLQEIYDLRVESWSNSEMGEFVNRKYFPNGWHDKLDDNALHWIIEINGNIIASSRICVLENFDNVNENFKQFLLPPMRPFAFYSRLVIHPNYRKMGISFLMDKVRIEFLKSNNIDFTLAWASTKKRIDQLLRIGFVELGLLSHNFENNPKTDISPALILHLNSLTQ